MAEIARFLKPSIYVELGIYDGDTVRAVAKHAKKIIAVDIEPCRFEEPKMEFRHGRSVDVLATFDDDSIDMVFLDSSHEEGYTMDEFALLDKKVMPNGVVLFHDGYPPNKEHTGAQQCGGVYRAISRIKALYSDRWEFCTLPSQFGLTLSRKNLGRQVLWDA